MTFVGKVIAGLLRIERTRSRTQRAMRNSNFTRAYNRSFTDTPTDELVFRLRADAATSYDDLREIGAELRRRQSEERREALRGACVLCAGSGRRFQR